MVGSWGVKPMFTQLNINAWAFWILMFIIAVTFFALIRIIYLICMKKMKQHSLSTDVEQQIIPVRSASLPVQAIYTSVIAPHYFHNNGENFNESVNVMSETKNKYFEKFLKREDTFDGVDRFSASCDTKTMAIRPLTPAYRPHQDVQKEDPLGLLSVPPGFVQGLTQYGNQALPQRFTHSA